MITPSILPVASTQVDWQTFLTTTQQALGYNTLRGIDNLRREFSDPAKLLAAVAAFRGLPATANPVAEIREAGMLLRHLSYSFLIHCDEELLSLIRERTDLTITSAVSKDGNRVALVSGNLLQYRDGAANCCLATAPREVRLLFDGFVIYFERLGLHDVWGHYSKKSISDSTFLLEYKP